MWKKDRHYIKQDRLSFEERCLSITKTRSLGSVSALELGLGSCEVKERVVGNILEEGHEVALVVGEENNEPVNREE